MAATLIDILAGLVWGLHGVIAAHVVRDPRRAAVLALAVARLVRMRARFAALVARWQAGRLAPPGPARPRRVRRTRPVPAVPLPQGEAWLVRVLQPTAQWSLHLERLLAEPDCAALVADAPQAGRMLRPLCRMLGVAPPAFLRLPSMPPPRPPDPRRAARPRRPMGWERLPLPPLPAPAAAPDFFASHVFAWG